MRFKHIWKRHSVFEWVTQGFLLLMGTLYLLYAGDGRYQNIQNAKYHIFRLICGGYIAIMAICLCESLILGSLKLHQIKDACRNSSWAQRFAIAYMLLVWISALLSSYWPETVVGNGRQDGALTITLYCLCFLLVSVFGQINRGLIVAFSVSLVAFCAISILQLQGLNPFHLYPRGYTYFDAETAYSGAFIGTIGNIDFVGAFLCLMIPALVGIVIFAKDPLRWLLLPVVLLMLYILLRISVAAGIAGIVAGGVLSAPFLCKWTGSKRRSLFLAQAGVIAIGILALYFCDIGQGTLHEMHELLHGRLASSFGSGRFHIWKQVLDDLPGHFWFGTGPDTMIHSNLEGFFRFDTELQATIVAQIDVAHNEYLNILSQQGFFSLLAYSGMLISTCWNWTKLCGANRNAGVLGCAAVSYMAQAFFGISTFIVAPYFWIILALWDKECSSRERRI